MVEDPLGEGLVITGALSLTTHPWLAEHAVFETPILPGTAFLEIALAAAERCGAEAVAELTLQAPLALPAQGAVDLQVSVSGPGEQGGRQISIHSRPRRGGGEEEPGEWTTHATGTLAPDAPPPAEPLAEWPPPGATPIATEGLYERLAEIGLGYGPAFQGLSAAWRSGEEIYAEVSLAPEQQEQAGRYAIHPALLDSALHAGLLGGLDQAEPQIALPFSWGQVSLSATGPGSLRVILTTQGEELQLRAYDQGARPVARVGSLRARPVSPEQLGAARPRPEALLGLAWRALEPPAPEGSPPALATLGESELEGLPHYADIEQLEAAITAGEPAPEAVLFAAAGEEGGEPPTAARAGKRGGAGARQALARL